jgi:hypothetical protein
VEPVGVGSIELEMADVLDGIKEVEVVDGIHDEVGMELVIGLE